MSAYDFVIAFCFIALAAVQLCALDKGGALPISPKDRWENLGVQVHRSRIYSQAVGRDTSGREVLYFGFSDAKPFVLALDPRTGKGRQLRLQDTHGQVWGLCAHSNGKAYATTGQGGIFELDAAKGEARSLGALPEGEDVVWELWEAADGNLYGGTYPKAKLVRVNPRKGSVEDLGRIDPELMYVRTVATKGEYVYCGCGVTKPSVWAYNIHTGEKTQLLPEEARIGPGWGRAFVRADGNVYIYGNGDVRFRVVGLKTEKVSSVPDPAPMRLADGTQVLTADRSGPDRVYWLAGPDGKPAEVHFDYVSAGTPLWDLLEGPDGCVYGNTHTPITLFAFDPKTRQTRIYGDPVGHAGQIYSWMWHKGRLHMAAYGECTYTVWDPSRPWNFGTRPENNPRRIGNTSRSIQRAGAMMLVPDGQHVLVGGLPGYGRIGGGVAVVDPDAATFDIIERPCGDQSPWSFAATPDPAVIAIGTSAYAGTGAKRKLDPARLVFWDWKRRAKVCELTPWEDQTVIVSLLRVGDELFICGAPHGKIAVHHFSARKIVYMANYGYGGGRLRWRQDDGCIYAFMGGRVVRIHPTSRQHEVLGTYPGLATSMAIVGGYAYGFEGANLIRFRLD